jgi:hypothetical protein
MAQHVRRSMDASARALEPADKARDRLIELAAADET